MSALVDKADEPVEEELVDDYVDEPVDEQSAVISSPETASKEQKKSTNQSHSIN